MVSSSFYVHPWGDDPIWVFPMIGKLDPLSKRPFASWREDVSLCFTLMWRNECMFMHLLQMGWKQWLCLYAYTCEKSEGTYCLIDMYMMFIYWVRYTFRTLRMLQMPKTLDVFRVFLICWMCFCKFVEAPLGEFQWILGASTWATPKIANAKLDGWNTSLSWIRIGEAYFQGRNCS